MENMEAIDLISNYFVVNTTLARSIGLRSAIFLWELITINRYHQDRNELVTFEGEDGEWFCATIDFISMRTTLSKQQQIAALKKLVNMGFVKVNLRELSQKRYFQILPEGFCVSMVGMAEEK